MTQVEILEEFTPAERLSVIEAALHLIREDIQEMERPSKQAKRRRQLAAAAEALLPDCTAGGELTIFANI